MDVGRNRYSLILGAGYSKWAAGLPLVSGLFDFAVAPFGKREPNRLDRVKALKSSWDAEHSNTHPEEFVAAVHQMGREQQADVDWYICRRLSEPFIWQEYHAQRWRRHVFMIDENRCPRPGAQFLAAICSGNIAGIITTNYDLLVEYALTTDGFNYGRPGEVLTGRGPYPVSSSMNPVRLTGRIPLAKLHGSINWDEDGRYTDGRRALTGGALVVAPVPSKEPPEQLSHVWELALDILRNSTVLVVFGFSFNPLDKAVLSLLRSAGGGLEKVLLVDVSPPAIRARALWPHADISSAGPPPNPKPDRIISWLQAL